MKIPHAALQQHTAVLGKTGSGKTSTAKLAIEQVVAAGARVCILDPIKSDWWGLTSSADGKAPGLPFQILGGPHGHVPLHSSAGKAVGELVARGELRESIIDMADFEPGGQARFFVDFAPALLRAMRGVVYLVIEEAHIFAPKEKSGLGSENLSIHWAKMIATAGRSKGVRLVLVTQRTQSLHNALLGSCETLIAHRLSAPADQEPILKWLKANVDTAAYGAVAGSLSSLATGEGWICSGEAKIFQRAKFPRIATYDNSATPTDDEHRAVVATAPVDREALRAILGKAVDDAAATDPKALRERIADLERQVAAREPRTVSDPAAEQRAEERGYVRGLAAGYDAAAARLADGREQSLMALDLNFTPAASTMRNVLEEARELAGITTPRKAPAPRSPAPRAGSSIPKVQRAFLTALAQQQRPLTRNQVAIFAGYSATSRHVDNTLAALRSQGFVVGGRDAIEITPAGLKALGAFDPLPTGAALRDYWMRDLDKAASEFLRVVCAAYPAPLTRDEVAERAGYSPTSRHVDNTLAQLRSRDLVSGGRAAIRASDTLFR